MVPLERHLLSNSEVVLPGLVPVDEVNLFGDFASLDLFIRAVAQQAVDSLVVAVERPAVVLRFGLQQIDGSADIALGCSGSWSAKP